MRPVSNLDQTGTSLNDISKAPVDMSCPSRALSVGKKLLSFMLVSVAMVHWCLLIPASCEG